MASPEMTVGDLAPEGFSVLAWPAEAPLADLAERLGIAVHRRDMLRPRADGEGRSLSARHGLGGFPWHTDGAQLGKPPDWLLMRAVTKTKTPTLFVDGLELIGDGSLRRELRGGSWLVEASPRPFLASALEGREPKLRWNPDVMRARGPRAVAAELALAVKLSGAKINEHSWRVGEALLVDNHRWLHSRPAIASTDLKRELERLQGDGKPRMGR